MHFDDLDHVAAKERQVLLGHRLHARISNAERPPRAGVPSEPIFSDVEKPQDEKVARAQFIPHQVASCAKFADFARIELAQPRASARKVEQRFGRIDKGIKNCGSRIRIMAGLETMNSI